MKVLRGGGIKVCLTTGFSDEVQRAVIEHLGWDDVIGLLHSPERDGPRAPVPRHGPNPALRAQVDDVREVAVVGDTANDLWSGHRAGASVVAGVLTGSHKRAELQGAPSHRHPGLHRRFPGRRPWIMTGARTLTARRLTPGDKGVLPANCRRSHKRGRGLHAGGASVGEGQAPAGIAPRAGATRRRSERR